MKKVFLYLGVALLFTHELDAMTHHDMSHEHYAFESWLSNVLIFGGGICGLGYLLLSRPSQNA
jgi:hypothetical protein